MKKFIINADVNAKIEGEVWKELPNFDGRYLISNYGRIKRLEYVDSRGWRRKERMIRPTLTPSGAYQVQLFKEGKATVHRHHNLMKVFNEVKQNGTV